MFCFGGTQVLPKLLLQEDIQDPGRFRIDAGHLDARYGASLWEHRSRRRGVSADPPEQERSSVQPTVPLDQQTAQPIHASLDCLLFFHSRATHTHTKKN